METSSTTISTSSTTTTTTPQTTLPPQTGDGMLYQVGDQTVEVSLRATTADAPPDGYDGFSSVVQLDSGAFVASGFDAREPGGQPERSALWHSADGFQWDRVGKPIGAGVNQQQVAALYVDGDGVHALEVDLEIPPDAVGVADVRFGATREWISEDGVSWSIVGHAGEGVISDVEQFGGEVVAYGAVQPNIDGEFAASIAFRSEGGIGWTDNAIVNDTGDRFLGSFVEDVIAVDGAMVAVGGTAETDPLSSSVGSLVDMQLVKGPSDVGIWRSNDAGSTWDLIETDTFSGQSGPSYASAVVSLGGSIYLLASTAEAYQTTVALYRSDDLGDSWERVRIEKALASDVGNTTQLSNTGLWVLDGLLVVVEERLGFEQNMFLTVFDPESGESETRSLTDELGVVQLEDALTVESGVLGFGRVGRGTARSDLQVVDIRRVDASVTVPTTTPAIESVAERTLEPVSEESDPFGYRRARPRAATNLDPQWTIDASGFVVKDAVATDELIVFSTIASGDTHRVHAVDRATGAIRWQLSNADAVVSTIELVSGILVVDWSDRERLGSVGGYDLATGDALWTIDDVDRWLAPEPPSSDFLVRSFEPEPRDETLIDPATGALIGSYTPAGSSADARVTIEAGRVVELDPASLVPLGDGIPLPDQGAGVFRAIVHDRHVVVIGTNTLTILDNAGTIETKFPAEGIQQADALPVRAGSADVVIVDEGFALSLDQTLSPRWATEAESIERFGLIDGEMFGLAHTDQEAQLISLETGRMRCSLGDVARPTLLRHGFFVDGDAFGLDCEPLWSSGDDDAVVVDGGVLTFAKVGDGLSVTFHE